MQKDFFHIPPKYSGDVKVFTANSSVTLQGYQIWQKPKGASLVYMLVVGGGAGGGGGFTRVAGNAGGGGAGGACSGISRFTCPAILLPDTIYIQVGSGGQGGAANANGGGGINSYVLTSKTAVVPNIILYSNTVAAPPGGGGAGTAIAGGTGGTVPGIPAVTQPPNIWGEGFSTVGTVGAAGGAQTGANGTSNTIWGTQSVSPGAGGAGCTTTDFNGGNITATATLDMGVQGYYTGGGGGVATGGLVAGADGSAGVNRITPFFCSGGAGGASNNSGQAGIGGCGGYGSGGGGGGAGTTGGRGGNGGSGVVIIITI